MVNSIGQPVTYTLPQQGKKKAIRKWTFSKTEIVF